jgi:dipeptidyl aminopeptidase/acylaminoacyl peptidase
MKRAMVVVLLLMSCTLWVQAQVQATAPAKRAVTPEDLVTMTRLGGMDISPDGARVLYAASRTDYPKSDKPVGHIYLIPSSGGTPRQMTASEAGESSPVWSPDGTRFAFLSRRTGSPQVFVMPGDGGEGVQLGKLKIAPEGLKWSPDGKAVAFMAEPEPSDTEKAEDEATGDVEIMEAPKGMTQLFTLSYPEGKLEKVTQGDFNVSEFSWSPDGKRFALLTGKTQLLYDNMCQASVRVVDLKGKTLAVLSPKEGALQGPPVFSPDGSKVAWRYPSEGQSDMNGVAVCGADGKGFSNAATKVDVHFAQIQWLPDGKSLLALTYEGTRGLLRKLSLQSGDAPVLYAPAGVIGAFHLDRAADRLCLSYTDPATPNSPWSLKADGTGAVQLADLNPQIKEWILPAVERFTIETAPGVRVETLLWSPPQAAGAPPAPLMVMPHGGPDWMDQEGFDQWAAYLAGKGYAVLNVNFRGSLGYGLAFYAANRGKEGFVDYDDIMAVLDHVVKAGKADPQKLVIGGWSYGGCMTEWAITRTDRFKAAVVGAGVANYYSNYAQSDINHGVSGEWEFLGNPYDNPENYTKGSAVYHIKSVKTPVLILHGKDDDRVPYVQGLELYRALKTTGKEVEMVSYPGEGHGFRKPVHNVDRLKRWTAFYDKALGIKREEPKKPEDPKKDEAKAKAEAK